MVQVPKLRHRKLGEKETEEPPAPHRLPPPPGPRAPSRAPDELWEVEGACEDTSAGQQILADHSDPFRVLRGQRVGGYAPRPSAHDITPVPGTHPANRRGHLDVQSECPGHRIHLVVHSEHPVLNWRRREDAECWVEFGEGCSHYNLGKRGDLGRWETLGIGRGWGERQCLLQAKCAEAVPMWSGV